MTASGGIRVLVMVPLLLVLLTCGMAAQQPTQTDRPPPVLDPVHARAPVFSPGSGPPGTAVTVRTSDLPAITPIYLGIGAARSSFEVVSELVTDEYGVMTDTVEIPSWATSDRTHFFVLVDVYFRPLAVSGGFHVTEQDGTLMRSGRITDEGVNCLAMREEGETGELYTLTGATQGLEPGDDVVVEGTLVENSVCMQGATVRVTRIDR